VRSEVGNVKTVYLNVNTWKYSGQSDAEVFDKRAASSRIDDVECRSPSHFRSHRGQQVLVGNAGGLDPDIDGVLFRRSM
jgi:hypothetical protein